MMEQHYSVLFWVARWCWRVSPKLAQWVNDVDEGWGYYRMRRWSHSHGEENATGFLAVGLMPDLIAIDYRGRNDEWLWGYLSDALSIAGDNARRRARRLTEIERVRMNKLLDELLKEEHVPDADSR